MKIAYYLCGRLQLHSTKYRLLIMSWKQAFSSSVGKKIQMSLTGIFLILFLIVHCYINAQIWFG